MRLQALLPRSYWQAILSVFMLVGFYVAVIRYTQGLGAVANINDDFPWGIWIGFDILCGVGLAAGGFTIGALVYIFNIRRFHTIVRPALLTAFLGYLLVIMALMVDLGRPYRIWHALVMWNPHSVMFEVAWCVMLYTIVLALEFSPLVLERFRMARTLKIVKFTMPLLVILGVLLSTLHQSSLGSLYLIVPEKMSPLWYTPLLPVLFLVSAAAVGFAMVIFESFLSSRAFNKHLEMNILMELARILLFILVVYAVLRFQDLFHRAALASLWPWTLASTLFVMEILLGILLPAALLAFPKIRQNPGGLFSAVTLVIMGFILQRMNVSITSIEAATGVHYVPSWMELAITLAIVAAGLSIFSLAVQYLAVFPDGPTRKLTAQSLRRVALPPA